MGKRIISQRRGRGSPTYRSPSHRATSTASIPNGEAKARVIDIEHDQARTAPIAQIQYDNGETDHVLAPEGIAVGDLIEISRDASLEPGNTLPLKQIPEGVPIYNIELKPGDGGKIARSAGTYSFIVAQEPNKVQVYLPSKEIKTFTPDCRASIGKVAGAGRTKRKFRKAGQKHHAMKARGKLYPNVSAVSMNAVDHPFGGSATPGKPKTITRHSSSGATVGSISASRTGQREQ